MVCGSNRQQIDLEAEVKLSKVEVKYNPIPLGNDVWTGIIFARAEQTKQKTLGAQKSFLQSNDFIFCHCHSYSYMGHSTPSVTF